MFSPSALAGASSLVAAPKRTDAPVSTDAPRVKAMAPAAIPHDSSYYAKCMMGGILSCGLTHTGIVTLDLVKCRMQVMPEVYTGMVKGFSLVSAGGIGEMTVGWLPTLIGYSAQGFCKFGFYEVFKDVYADAMGRDNVESSALLKNVTYLSASATAEFIADIALCPWEALKVRMQTSTPETNFPRDLGAAMARINAEEGINGFYKGITPLWGRQIPYTMVKFGAFENIVRAFYTYLFNDRPKKEYPKSTQLGITFASGYVAGVFCAIVSHPADTIVSKLNQNDKASIGTIVNEMGLYNLATKGLFARIIMIGTLTGFQWWIYDTFKTAVGLQASG